ncbi:MAG: HAMP domain-containing histidine kinase [Bacteroidales bacterium]|nr:HAMP domain-containing histidine kinase [Bacteroidales bacterium]
MPPPKNSQTTHFIPVVFVTAKVESEDIIKGFEAGGSDYVTKPFNLMELLSRVKAHLNAKFKQEKLQLINSKLIESVKLHAEQLKEANERLAKLDKAKNDFLIHINHELRTPLNGILGYAEVLNQLDDTTEEQLEYLAEISKLVKRLVKRSERSLLFTELKSETYKLNIQLINAPDSLERSIVEARERYNDKNLTVKNNKPAESFKILADEHLFFRLGNIILDNAIKFSPNGSNISVMYKIEDNTKVIEISDEGQGISESFLLKAFDAFSTEKAKKDNGFGLGLATAKLIMEIQSGEIYLHNRPEGGLTVRLVFYNWSNLS